MVYRPPTKVVTRSESYLALVTGADPDWARYKFWDAEYLTDHRALMANPYQRGIYNRLSNTYPVGSQYGLPDPLVSNLSPTNGNLVPGLYVPPAYAKIQLVQSISTQVGFGGTLTLPQAPTKGNFVVCVMRVIASGFNPLGAANIVDGNGNSYRLAVRDISIFSNQTVCFFYLENVPQNASPLLIPSFGPFGAELYAAEFTGVAINNSLGSTTTFTPGTPTSGASIQDTPLFTPDTDGSLVVAYSWYTNSILSANSPWTLIGTSQNGDAASFSVQTKATKTGVNLNLSGGVGQLNTTYASFQPVGTGQGWA